MDAAAILVCAALITGLPPAQTVPVIEQRPYDDLDAMRDAYPDGPYTFWTKGIYFPHQKNGGHPTIWLFPEANEDILLHEMVHHLQWVNGLPFSEDLPYEVQSIGVRFCPNKTGD